MDSQIEVVILDDILGEKESRSDDAPKEIEKSRSDDNDDEAPTGLEESLWDDEFKSIEYDDSCIICRDDSKPEEFIKCCQCEYLMHEMCLKKWYSSCIVRKRMVIKCPHCMKDHDSCLGDDCEHKKLLSELSLKYNECSRRRRRMNSDEEYFEEDEDEERDVVVRNKTPIIILTIFTLLGTWNVIYNEYY